MPLFTFFLLRRSMERNRAKDGSTPGGGRGLMLLFGLILLGLAGLIGLLEWWATSTAK